MKGSLNLDKRTEERILGNSLNLWVWYEAAKCMGAESEEQLIDVAKRLGIGISQDVEKAISEGFQEYQWSGR